MPPLHDRGLYEALITEALNAKLAALGSHLEEDRSELHEAEAADRIALHLSKVIERAIASLDTKERVPIGTALARRLVDLIVLDTSKLPLEQERPIQPAHVLRSIAHKLPDGRPEEIPQPLIPLLDTTLLTNSPGEPRVGSQIQAEIHSADRIDIIMAFIRRSGIAPMREALRQHCQAGRAVRVLTTTYTGTTEAAALEVLRELGAHIRVSYDQSGTRLHAKAWLFNRRSGYSTAYIGSSNLTHSAQVTGLEWNIRVSGARNPAVVDKVAAVFESYWNSGDFIPYDPDQFAELSGRGDAPQGFQTLLSPIEVRLEPFQERLLELVALSRERGHHRNLLVSATGTGKTVMAAVDYGRLRERLPRSRLLFVAHREEILTQTIATFRHALRDQNFGELWVGRWRPRRFEHVFASIQSLHASGLEHLQADHFDVVIVDEFHHAAASTYRWLLDQLHPRQLLGLTATPERSDGLPVLDWFSGRIAAELRLWDAIDQHRLVPFAYYGVHDGQDLTSIPWRRGTGYDVEGLTNLYTANDVWARLVIGATGRRVDDIHHMRALGFCVSVAHARFMARVFREAGIEATAIWADTPEVERRRSLDDLARGEVQVVFCVDLFNEGVDVPQIDTLLMLRPTDSPTLFLQQLGRGLRRSGNKSVCTVLDFVGHHRQEFRFDRRLRALLGGTRKDVERQVEQGFPFLPAGCHMELDHKSSEIIIDSIRRAIPSRWGAKVQELRAYAQGLQGDPSLAGFLEASGLELGDVYAGEKKSWSDLRQDAGLAVYSAGPHEGAVRRAVARMLHVDDMGRIGGYGRLLRLKSPPRLEDLAERDRRLLRMLVASLSGQVLPKSATLEEGGVLLWDHPQVIAELVELLGVLAERVDHLPRALAGHPEVPLTVHGQYTRVEMFAAFGIGEGAGVPLWQTGVHWAREAGADLFAFTLDKSCGHFSPTTRYRDYAISPELIHWESQGVTREDSETGQRYRRHVELGTSVMLFARLRSDQRAFHFLGPATYVSHESEMPMAITWRLSHPLPGDLFAAFAAAVA